MRPVAWLHQALVDQRRYSIEHIESEVVSHSTHGLGGLDREPPDEDTQPHKEALLGLVKQLEAPLDRTTQRLLAWTAVACPTGQEAQAVVEPREQCLHGKQLDASC